uniref:Uncharacterized protein n=1 Tax=Pipistrellus kuhlii TaxID=59472 RepID=A0A7J7TW07_PIPKU|nr:hypothetical protein mPipKuh1_009227 [Pipistrellus kuhlii]
MKCGITKPYRILVLICTVTAMALLWWAFSLSTWAKVDIANGRQVLFSALFATCSQEVKCWVPPPRSCVCVFLALLLHTLYIWRVTDIFKEAKVTLLYPYFILSVSIMLFFLSGILCFVSAHHCWFWCVLQRPIQVEPMQTPMASHCPVTDSENKLSADSYPTLRGNRGNCLSSLHFKTSQLHALV